MASRFRIVEGAYPKRSGNQPGTYQARLQPFNIAGIRAPSYHQTNLSVQRSFRIWETLQFQMRLDALNGYLAKMRPSLLNQNDVKLKADSRLKYEYVMEVMDICRRAGFSNVGFDAPPDLARVVP